MMRKFNLSLTVFSFTFGSSEFISQNFDYSTADIEDIIFFGDFSNGTLPEPEEPKGIEGTFKLLDGNLYEIVNLAPPNAVPIQKSSGLLKLAGL